MKEEITPKEKTIQDLIEELEYSKKAVEDCLKSDLTLVDMHWLVYRAERVEKLRAEIKKRL